MKKKILIMAMAAILIATIASGTLAYFNSEDTAHNVIASGAVDIMIEEFQQTENGLVPYPSGEKLPVMPGTELSKIVTVENLEQSAYIRVKAEITVYDKDEKAMEIAPEKLAKIISLDIDEEKWTDEKGDGWWYYTEAVKSAESTEAFFTKVIFDGPAMTNEYQNCTVHVTVKAQATQTANNGTDALTAVGWSAE